MSHQHQNTGRKNSHPANLARRRFLQTIGAGGLAGGIVNWPDLMALKAEELRKKGMACIILWMQGAPSQFETFSPKPGHENGGETKAISTAASGIQISENLPQVARVMDRLCVIRSMSSKEGSHPRATFLMHTGYVPTASVKYPEIGAHIAQQLGDSASELPSFVRIGRSRINAKGGFLGVDYNPYVVDRAGGIPDNAEPATSTKRYRRRLALLDSLETHYAEHGGKQEVAKHRKLYRKSSQMVMSPKMSAFDLSQEPEHIRKQYGDSQFGADCLLARRLVEAGVPAIEISVGNWDTHFDNFSRTSDLCGQIDQPFAALIRDLETRGMLDKTLVVWTGEFGRTPRVNGRGGRDHYPRAYNAVLAGGGVQGGQVIGKTDASGESIEDRPVGVSDFLRTICHSLKIDADIEHMSGIGRPIRVVDGGEPVMEAFG